jgi:hypothetical protein
MPALALTEAGFQEILKGTDHTQILAFVNSTPNTEIDIRRKELAIVKMGETYKLNKYRLLTKIRHRPSQPSHKQP